MPINQRIWSIYRRVTSFIYSRFHWLTICACSAKLLVWRRQLLRIFYDGDYRRHRRLKSAHTVAPGAILSDGSVLCYQQKTPARQRAFFARRCWCLTSVPEGYFVGVFLVGFVGEVDLDCFCCVVVGVE